MPKRQSQENEERDLSRLSSCLEEDAVLKDIWDNNVDLAYDKLLPGDKA